MTLTVRAVQGYALGRPVAGATVRSIAAYALVNPTPIVPGPPAPTNYQADQIDILYDLIEKSNPGFKTQFPKGTVVFGVPTAVALVPSDPYKTDTSIKLNGAPNSGVMGTQTVRYRRIDLGVIFRNMTLTMNDYSATTQLAVATWKASFAQKFGIKIPAADISNTTSLTTATLTNVIVAATSLCYKGTTQVTWTQGPRRMSDIFTNANRALVGRLYPGGNDFTTPGRIPQGEFQLFCQDASDISATLEAHAVGGVAVGSGVATVLAIIAWLNQNSGKTYWSTASHTTLGGLGGLSWYRYTLPNATVPEANSAKYNRCFVIQSSTGSWFAGKLILHYNA